MRKFKEAEDQFIVKMPQFLHRAKLLLQRFSQILGTRYRLMNRVPKDLRQYRIKIVPILRSQIFRQMKQKPQLILVVLTRIFVKYDGKYASKMGAKLISGLCAVLP